MIILAGVAINLSLGNNGIFNRAQYAIKLTDIAKVEEDANLAYANLKVNDQLSEPTLSDVIDELSNKNYIIHQKNSGERAIKDIKLQNDEITMNEGETREISFKIIYDTNVRYFVEIKNKNYEITLKDNKIQVDTEETNIKNMQDVTPSIEIETNSENNAIATAEDISDDNSSKILVEAYDINENKTVNIEIKVKNTNIKKILKVNVNIVYEISLDRTIIIFGVNNTKKINATVSPVTTSEVTWTSDDSTIASVTQDGTVTGVGLGTTTIHANCENGTKSCTIQVKEKQVLKSATKSNYTYTITASSEYRAKEGLFDGNIDAGEGEWHSKHTDNPAWIAIEFDRPVIVIKIVLTNRSGGGTRYDVSQFTLKGINNDSSPVTIGTYTNTTGSAIVNNHDINYNYTNDGFKKYKLEVGRNDYFSIGELEIEFY